MTWNIGEPLTKEHFRGTFGMQDDEGFIGTVTKCQIFCDVFNDMIERRINIVLDGESRSESTTGGKFSIFDLVDPNGKYKAC